MNKVREIIYGYICHAGSSQRKDKLIDIADQLFSALREAVLGKKKDADKISEQGLITTKEYERLRNEVAGYNLALQDIANLFGVRNDKQRSEPMRLQEQIDRYYKHEKELLHSIGYYIRLGISSYIDKEEFTEEELATALYGIFNILLER